MQKSMTLQQNLAGIHILLILSKSSAEQVSLMIHLPRQNLGCSHMICQGLMNQADSKQSEEQLSSQEDEKWSELRYILLYMITLYENFEKILWLSKTLLVQRITFGVILVIRTTFESSGTTGWLRIWIPDLVTPLKNKIPAGSSSHSSCRMNETGKYSVTN